MALYKREHRFLLVGGKYVVSTEIQVIKNENDKQWFGSDEKDCILYSLDQYLVKRMSTNLKDPNDLQIFEESGILVALKYISYGSKDTILIRKEQMALLGLTTSKKSGGGDYDSFILYPEKLIVIVAMKNNMDDFQNLTLGDVVLKKSSSEYFQHLTENSNSAAKKKNTLKKICTKIGSDNIYHNNVMIDRNNNNGTKAVNNNVQNVKERLEKFRRKKQTPLFNRNSDEKHTISEGNESVASAAVTKKHDSFDIYCCNHNFKNIEDISERKQRQNRKQNSSILELAGIDDNFVEICYKSNDDDKQNEMVTGVNRKIDMVILTENNDIPVVNADKVKSTVLKRTKRKKKSKLTMPSRGRKRLVSEIDDNKKSITMGELLSTKEERSDKLLECSFESMADDTVDVEDNGKVEQLEQIRQLSITQIKDLVHALEDEIKSIFSGKTKCDRHDQFKKGWKEKGCLNMQVSFGLFSNEQEDAVLKTLVEIFCSSHGKYFDYVMKVLLPETMALLYGNIANISREEANLVIMSM